MIDRENRRILVQPVQCVGEPLRGRLETEKLNQKRCSFEGIGSFEEALLHDHAAVGSEGDGVYAWAEGWRPWRGGYTSQVPRHQ